MDCRTTLELLDVARPDTDDRMDPALASARAHLDTCPACEAAFRRRQALDRTIGLAMRDVPLPPGLKGRLLDALAAEAAARGPLSAGTAEGEAESGTPAPVPVAEPAASPDPECNVPVQPNRTTVERRTWLRAAAALAAVCLLAAVGVWQWAWSSATLVLLDDVYREIPLDHDEVNALADFGGAFEPQLPQHEWSHRYLHLATRPKGWKAEARGPQNAAIYTFAFEAPRRQPLSGVLVVLPLDGVDLPPTSRSFSGNGADTGYATRDGRNWAYKSWTDGERVYICFVEGNLEFLQRALRPAHTA